MTELMTAAELAEYLKVKPSTIETWAKNGKLPLVKVGSLNRFRRSDIDAWLAKNERPVEEPSEAAAEKAS